MRQPTLRVLCGVTTQSLARRYISKRRAALAVPAVLSASVLPCDLLAWRAGPQGGEEHRDIHACTQASFREGSSLALCFLAIRSAAISPQDHPLLRSGLRLAHRAGVYYTQPSLCKQE